MASRPRVHVGALSPLVEDSSNPGSTTSATPESSLSSATTMSPTTPARGKETAALLRQKLRSPQLVHAWEFWHEKPVTSSGNTATTSSATAPSTAQNDYQTQLTHLHSITNIKDFWSVFNNFDVSMLGMRTSVHLFHRSVKPIWEDPRNARGGAWTFRVPRAQAAEFWKDICLLAIGEQLQEAVKDPFRTSFFDDICGVSFQQRFGTSLVSVWNRDGEHTLGIEKMLEVVKEELPAELVPKEGSYYYKKHSDHVGFKGNEAEKSAVVGADTNDAIATDKVDDDTRTVEAGSN